MSFSQLKHGCDWGPDPIGTCRASFPSQLPLAPLLEPPFLPPMGSGRPGESQCWPGSWGPQPKPALSWTPACFSPSPAPCDTRSHVLSERSGESCGLLPFTLEKSGLRPAGGAAGLRMGMAQGCPPLAKHQAARTCPGVRRSQRCPSIRQMRRQRPGVLGACSGAQDRCGE